MNEIDNRRELFGFLHEETFTSARQAADIRGRMTEFAARWNYRLTKIYTEKPGRQPEAFEALRAAVARDGAAVVVPTGDHLAPYGTVPKIVEDLEQASGHPVLRSEPLEARP
ncbi:hypothetical protein AB0P21_12915 [Kribbella sp. NPDC056861]|uniref:hypothetical protein n=1 Tax=Kribbella sp. NPDC056861 TaxID=3154857 RepID=UPI0034308B7C